MKGHYWGYVFGKKFLVRIVLHILLTQIMAVTYLSPISVYWSSFAYQKWPNQTRIHISRKIHKWLVSTGDALWIYFCRTIVFWNIEEISLCFSRQRYCSCHPIAWKIAGTCNAKHRHVGCQYFKTWYVTIMINLKYTDTNSATTVQTQRQNKTNNWNKNSHTIKSESEDGRSWIISLLISNHKKNNKVRHIILLTFGIKT